MSVPIVFIHGWASGTAVWEKVTEGLSARQCISVSLPGYGDTASDWSSPEAVLVSQLPPVCHLVGWSLGGNLAMAIAQQYPERIASVITVASVPQFVANETWPWAMPREHYEAFEAGFEQSPRATLTRFCSLQSQGETDAKTLSKVLRGCNTASSEEVLSCSLSWLAAVEQTKAWLRPPIPHLALFGERDALVPVSAASHCPRAIVLNNCGHAPMVSATAPLVSAMEAFWQSL